jgi:hypothetical protein
MDIFKSKLPRVKILRWFSWFDNVDKFLGFWHVVLMVLVYMLRSNGTITQMSDLRRNQQQLDEKMATAKVAAKKAKDSGVKPTVAHGNPEVDALRSTCKNTPHLVAKILYNHRAYRIAVLCIETVAAIREAHGKHVILLRTQKGTLEYFLSMARGSYQEVLGKTFAKLVDKNTLARAQFEDVPPQHIVDGPNFSWSEFDFEDDDEVAAIFFNLIVQILRFRGLSAFSLEFGLPWIFVGLVSGCADTLKTTLSLCQDLWLALLWAERLALDDRFIARFLKRLCWPSAWWIRFVLITLSEFDFKAVPQWMKDDLVAIFQSMWSTDSIENFFNKCRDKERTTKSNRFGPTFAWAVAVGSDLIEVFIVSWGGSFLK